MLPIGYLLREWLAQLSLRGMDSWVVIKLRMMQQWMSAWLSDKRINHPPLKDHFRFDLLQSLMENRTYGYHGKEYVPIRNNPDLALIFVLLNRLGMWKEDRILLVFGFT